MNLYFEQQPEEIAPEEKQEEDTWKEAKTPAYGKVPQIDRTAKPEHLLNATTVKHKIDQQPYSLGERSRVEPDLVLPAPEVVEKLVSTTK